MKRPGVKVKTLPGGRYCNSCKKPKQWSEFHNSARGYNGKRARCKECENSENKRRRDAGLAKKYPYNPEKQRIYVLRSEYGLEPDDYERMLSSQEGVCAICKEPETSVTASGRTRRLSVDHDHESGQIRSLLCSYCNMTIGLSLEDPKRLESCAWYLREWGKS